MFQLSLILAIVFCPDMSSACHICCIYFQRLPRTFLPWEQTLLTQIRLVVFVLKMLSAFNICCIFLKALTIIFTMEANTMNPDQTVWPGSILFAYISYKLHKQIREQVTIAVNDRKKLIFQSCYYCQLSSYNVPGLPTGKFFMLFCCLLIFSKSTVLKNPSRNTTWVSNRLDPYQAGHFVGLVWVKTVCKGCLQTTRIGNE